MTIGITYTGNAAKQQFYINYIQQNNKNINVITLNAEENNLHDLDKCNGVVLSGGVDMHPDFFGGNAHYPNAPAEFDKARDLFELAIFEKAKTTMPVLGICRGLQLINVALGGTLIYDLGSLNELHTAEDSFVADKIHDVVVEKDSLLYNIAQATHGNVTSAHHQAIDVLGNNLKANAFSYHENIIEGIEWEDATNKPFMLAVQWHPERMFRIGEGNSGLSLKIRDAFVNAING